MLTEERTDGETGRQVGMTNIIVAIRTFAKTPTNGCPKMLISAITGKHKETKNKTHKKEIIS
jgi:hypothetical protein